MNELTIRNTTVSAIEYDTTGAYIGASDTLTVPPQDYGIWANQDAITQITPDVNSGDVVIGNGTNDLSAALGLAHLRRIVYEGVGSPSVVSGITCAASVAVGDFVRMSGTTAVKALADSFLNSHVIGLVESKLDSTTCEIRLSGVGGDLFTGLDVSKPYFLSSSTAGAVTLVPPVGSGNYVCQVGIALTDKRLLVEKTIRMGRS